MNTERPKVLYYPGYPALAYADVYVAPRYSDITSRRGPMIDTSTHLTRDIVLPIPIITAGMDTVTEDWMAISIASVGGIGEIHRNNTPENQAHMVRRVKEHMRLIEDHPPMVSEDATIQDVQTLLARRKRGYVIVHAPGEFKGTFTGMATMKDFEAGSRDMQIYKVMTPLVAEIPGGRQLIIAPRGTTFEEAVRIMRQHRIEKLPILNPDGTLAGVYTIKDYDNRQKLQSPAIDAKGRLLVGAAIGVKDKDLDRAWQLKDAEVDVLFLDIAHGHSRHSQEALERLHNANLGIPIIAGNVATGEGVRFLADLGADGVKVGIGPGGVCTTRNVAGVGVPQISALLEAREAVGNMINNPPTIIADGGIREPGDVAKAMTIADTVMIGSQFAGTDKSPGEPITIPDKGLMKRVRGMASAQVTADIGRLNGDNSGNTRAPEGRETLVLYQGPFENIIQLFDGGLRSGMSYAGAHTIAEMHEKGQLIYVSQHGSQENTRKM